MLMLLLCVAGLAVVAAVAGDVAVAAAYPAVVGHVVTGDVADACCAADSDDGAGVDASAGIAALRGFFHSSCHEKSRKIVHCGKEEQRTKSQFVSPLACRPHRIWSLLPGTKYFTKAKKIHPRYLPKLPCIIILSLIPVLILEFKT